jgi:hypothetical protein
VTHPREPGRGGPRSGGPWVDPGVAGQEPLASDETERYQTVPPEDRVTARPPEGTAAVVRTIVVRDEQGQLVSVTKVASDARFGVGVKPKPGHTVTEFEAGTLAENPFTAEGANAPNNQGRP